jgi:predicted lipoprotein with Yx(FWY)xxD motif
MLRRSVPLLATTLAVVSAVATATPAAATGPRAVLELRATKVGKILVDANGYTLYAFDRDGRNRDACVRITGCLYEWPALVTSGTPVAGAGVRAALIGTIGLRGGQRQVTYAGRPLYLFIRDTRPAETTFVNYLQFGARWPAVGAAGQAVR